MSERKLVPEHSETKKNTWAKRSIALLKRYMRNILHLVMVYKVLIKPGSTNIHPQKGRIMRDM